MCDRIVELGVNKESIVVGTLYKEMSKKPCLLDEINVLEASAWVLQELRECVEWGLGGCVHGESDVEVCR